MGRSGSRFWRSSSARCRYGTCRAPGFNLVVLAPEGKLTSRLEELGVPVVKAEFGPDYGFKTSFASLMKAVEQLRPEIVHSHLAYADVVAVAVVNALRMHHLLQRSVWVPRLLTTEHGIAGNDSVYHGSSWRSKLMETVHRVRLWGTDQAIAVSRLDCRTDARQVGCPWRGAGVQRCGHSRGGCCRCRAACPRRGRPAHPLAISSIPEKGIDVLLDAFARACARSTRRLTWKSPVRVDLGTS